MIKLGSRLQEKISPLLFSRLCSILAFGILGVLIPALLWLNPKRVPPGFGPSALPCDFTQYYVGAVVVREGIWDALYPVPRSNVYDNAPQFEPQYQTVLFDPAKVGRQHAFYPPLNLASASDCKPALLGYVPEAVDQFRYIYPPPTALLFWPLSLVSYQTAMWKAWPTISNWSLFVLSLLAARIYRLLRGSVSYEEGLIILICLFVNYRGLSAIGAGNITPMVGMLIALATWCLMTVRLPVFSFALVSLVLIKGIGLMWLPVLLTRRFRRSLVYLFILAIVANGIVLALAGFTIYRQFFSLLPLISIPAGIGLVPRVIQIFGYYPGKFYLFFDVVVLGALYYSYWRSLRIVGAKGVLQGSELISLVALLAGTMALFCLMNFSVWIHYIPNYLVLPFLGWILLEGQLAVGPWKGIIFAGAIMSVAMTGGSWILWGASFHLFGATGVSNCRYLFYEPFMMIVIPLFFLAVALRRLTTTMSDGAE